MAKIAKLGFVEVGGAYYERPTVFLGFYRSELDVFRIDFVGMFDIGHNPDNIQKAFMQANDAAGAKIQFNGLVKQGLK